MRVLIDANVPMYAAGVEHPLKSPSLRVLEAAACGRIVAVTDAEVLQEIMHRYALLNSRDKGADVVELFVQILQDVLPVTREDMAQALVLYREHSNVQTRDAVHAAVMANHGITAIVTADRHFDLFPGLRRIDPMDAQF
jgi:hypothetical protein